jgi:MFS family permease
MDTGTVSSAGLIQQRPFVLFWLARLASTMGYQMLALTIGWQIYELTNSAFDLGLVGLIQFVPAVVLTLLIGHAADRYDRRLIVRAAQGVYALVVVMIAAALLTGGLGRNLLFAAVFMIGSARAFELPTAHALAPFLVPASLISRAVAAWTSANQTAIICGPALGGLVYALSPVLVGVICLFFRLLDHTGQSGPCARAGARPRTADVCVGNRRLHLHSRAPPLARGDYP